MGSSAGEGPDLGGLRRIGRYGLVVDLEAEFGQRWVGVVTEGPERGRLVLIRRFPTDGLAPSELQRLTRAGITAMVIRHPKVAAVLDVVAEGGHLAVVSEYVEGESLRNLQRLAAASDSPLPPPVVLSILHDAIEALRGARDQWKQMVRGNEETLGDAVHGGLAPDSVLIAAFGDTMLTEVGLAGAMVQHSSALRSPALLPYRAPEQLSRGRGMAERCDVFSLGVIAWELLANRPLFGHRDRFTRAASADAEELERSLFSGAIPPLDRLPRQGAPIAPAVVDLLRNALLRDPLKRIPSLDRFAGDVGGLPRELFASPEQVAVALDRLARSALQARRDALELEVGVDSVRESNPPASRRSTARPATGSNVARIEVPRLGAPNLDKLFASAVPPPAFPSQEAPTGRRRTPPPRRPPAIPPIEAPEAAEAVDEIDAVDVESLPGDALEVVTAPPPSPAAEAPPAEPSTSAVEAPPTVERADASAPTGPARPSSAGASSADTPSAGAPSAGTPVVEAPLELPPLEASSLAGVAAQEDRERPSVEAPKSRGRWPWIAGAGAVAAVVAIVMLRGAFSSPGDGVAKDPRTPEAPQPSVTATATPREPSALPTTSTAEAPPQNTVDAAAAPTSTADSPRPLATPRDPEPPKPAAPRPSGKPYRPKGI